MAIHSMALLKVSNLRHELAQPIGIQHGHPTRKNRGKAYNVVLCFLISFYGFLKGYLCEQTLFDMFGCGS